MHAVARHRLRRRHRQHSGELGQNGGRGRAPAARAGANDLGGTLMDENISRPRAHSTGSAWASRSWRRSWRRSAGPWCSAPPCTRRRARDRRHGGVGAPGRLRRPVRRSRPLGGAVARAAGHDRLAQRPGPRGHVGRRPQDRQHGPGRDGRGLPGVPSLPPHPQGHDVRFGPHEARRPDLHTGPRPGRQAGGGGLDGGDRGRPRHHGRRSGGGGAGARLRGQHPPAVRGRRQPLHRAGPEAGRDALLLHPQAHAHKGVPRLRRPARRLRDTGRVLRVADPAADGQGGAGAGRHGRDARGHLLARVAAFRAGRRHRRRLGLARGPGPLQGDQHAGRGRRRDPGLLPELPLHPLRGRPPGAPAAGATEQGRAGRLEPSLRRHCAAGQHPRHGPFPPERNDHPELPRLALRFDRFHFARLRQLIDAVNECTG